MKLVYIILYIIFLIFVTISPQIVYAGSYSNDFDRSATPGGSCNSASDQLRLLRDSVSDGGICGGCVPCTWDSSGAIDCEGPINLSCTNSVKMLGNGKSVYKAITTGTNQDYTVSVAAYIDYRTTCGLGVETAGNGAGTWLYTQRYIGNTGSGWYTLTYSGATTTNSDIRIMMYDLGDNHCYFDNVSVTWSPTVTPSSTPGPRRLPEAICNGICQTGATDTATCPSALSCTLISGELTSTSQQVYRCRNSSYPTSTTCSAPGVTPTPTPVAAATPVPGATIAPTATPAPAPTIPPPPADCLNSGYCCTLFNGLSEMFCSSTGTLSDGRICSNPLSIQPSSALGIPNNCNPAQNPTCYAQWTRCPSGQTCYQSCVIPTPTPTPVPCSGNTLCGTGCCSSSSSTCTPTNLCCNPPTATYCSATSYNTAGCYAVCPAAPPVPIPAPAPAAPPWIQTTGGDVHSNTGINVF